ncbi:MAG TPA: carboxypeptidase regulatory-like domain-containing protein [Thermoanaerobaculia bacterium]
MKKFVTLLFAATLVLSISCGKGKEAKEEEEGTDDQALQTATTAGTTAATAATAAAPVSAEGATITGVVKFQGAPPLMPALQMSADPYCASQHAGAPAKDEEVVLGPGGELANVFVYVKNISGNYPPPSTPVVLDQHGCQYHPHMIPIQVGQPLQIKNSDATLHNIHALPNVNSQFNEGQPVQGMVSTKKFDKAEITPFKVKCDVHGWMKAWMAVMPNPFYSVSQANGTFTISNLPPGQYTIVAWHEKYGSKEQQVTVAPKESKAVDFTFNG